MDAAWNPQLLTWLGGELSFRIGVYDDFVRPVTTDSLRFTGTGLGVVSLSPNLKVKAGVCISTAKKSSFFHPAALCGAQSDWYFNLLFPNPKVGRRLINYGTAEWWLYCTGDYGGGDWHITQRNPTEYDDFAYNDIRVAVGLEFKTYRNLNGWFEVGGAFSRNLTFATLIRPLFFQAIQYSSAPGWHIEGSRVRDEG